MNRICQKPRIWMILENVYKIVLLLLAFLNFNTKTYGTPLRTFFVVLTVVFAGLFLLTRLIDYKQYINNCVMWLLIAFMGSYLITTFISYEYGILLPIKTLVWMAMHFLLLYATSSDKTDEALRRDVRLILVIFSVVTFVSVCVSIGQLLTNYGGIRVHEDVTGQINLLYGFMWGRLWGVYYDPNYGSVFATISILIAIYFIHLYRFWSVRIVCILQIILQLLYIAFSDSRTGLVAGSLALAVFVYCRLLALKISCKSILKQAMCIVGSIVVIIALPLSATAIKGCYNTYITGITEQPDDSQTTPSETPSTDTPIAEEPPKSDLLVGREDDIQADISNHRFDLWKSAVETFLLRPIFGVPFNHLVAFSRDHCPETYLINNSRGAFNNYHNSFFNILVGQGSVGTLLLLVIAVICVIRAVKKVGATLSTSDSMFYAMAIAIVVAVLVASMFITELVYTNSPATVLFWIMLGILTHRPKKEEIHE